MELHQIFLDMAVLVEAQGEKLDNIQKQVERGADYVQTGTEAIVDAKKIQVCVCVLADCAGFIGA